MVSAQMRCASQSPLRKQDKIIVLPSKLEDFGSTVFIRSPTKMSLATDLILACCLTHTQIEHLSTKKD